MSEQKMFASSKHCRGLTPEAIKQFVAYPQFYAKVGRAKLAEYHRQLQESNTPPDDHLIGNMELEIVRAEAVEQALEQYSGDLQMVYTWHFEKLAELKRQARIVGGYQRIEDPPDLYRDTVLTMDMLKAENPWFSREKFINHINN